MVVDLTDNASLRHLKQPVALFFSYVDADRYDFYCKNNFELASINNRCRDQLIEYLLVRKYPAVSDENPLAAHPGSIVVSRHGIQTPFLKPDQARDFAMQLISDIRDSGFARPMSFVLGCTIEQLPPPVLFPQQHQSESPFVQHPDGRMLEFVKYRFGRDFLTKMRQEAYTQGESTEQLLNQPHDVQNLDEDLYSGRKFVFESFSIHARGNLESRYLNYATPSYKNAVYYAKEGGFIHHFEKSPDQDYYQDFGIELGAKPETDPSRQLETIVLPHQNAYKGVELYLKDRRFLIPLDEDKWQAFAEFYRVAYLPDSEILKQRRINIITEAKDNYNIPRTYMPFGYSAQNLILDRFENKKPLVLEDGLVTEPTIVRKSYGFWERSVREQQILGDLKTGIENTLQRIRRIRAEENAKPLKVCKPAPAPQKKTKSDTK